MNINNSEVKRKCCGCGMCSFKCPSKAISMIEDEKGFKYPIIDTKKCTNCGLCYKMCISMKKGKPKEITSNPHFAIKNKLDETRKISRSGGVFSAISDYVIENNGSVYGAILDNVKTIKHIRATTKKERDKMCGSKYVQSDINEVLISIDKDLKEGKMVLFTGTPCQCAAVKTLFEKYEKLYVVDFICHGVPSPGFYRKYIDYLENKYKDNVIDFTFRDKDKHSWDTHIEKATFNDKCLYSRRFTNLFCSNYIIRESCFECNFIKNKYSDITIGDYWGIEEIQEKFKDRLGVSVLIINTAKGDKIFRSIKKDIIYIDTTNIPLKHGNLKKPISKPNNYDEFWNYNIKSSFSRVSSKYGNYDVLHLLKYKYKDKIDRVVKKNVKKDSNFKKN